MLVPSHDVETYHGARWLADDARWIGHLLEDRVTDLTDLTLRERDVLALMAESRTNRSVCDRLSISTRTVESHVAAIFRKLDLPPEPDDHRRMLAVVTTFRSLRVGRWWWCW